MIPVRRYVGPPETSGTAPPQSTSTAPPATEVQSTLTAFPSLTQPPSSGSSGVNAGAIAGGVVGGLAFIAIVAVALFWFCTRKTHARPSEPEMYSPTLVAPVSAMSPPIPSPTPVSAASPISGEAYILQRKTHTANTSMDSFLPPDRSDSSNYTSRVSPGAPSVYTTYDPYARASIDNQPGRYGRAFTGAPEV
ncbi:hypothetical protein ONZ45_g19113 [Pleurotus djamor]|nr:hypothetical protein ONZ45_g19113 [Pleurotus djamor]